jgi:hypothetical protein
MRMVLRTMDGFTFKLSVHVKLLYVRITYCCCIQFAKAADVEEEVVHRLLGKCCNGRSLRRRVKTVIEALLPNICATYCTTLRFSELGEGGLYEDYDMHYRDAASLAVLLLCDPANRYVYFRTCFSLCVMHCSL